MGRETSEGFIPYKSMATLAQREGFKRNVCQSWALIDPASLDSKPFYSNEEILYGKLFNGEQAITTLLANPDKPFFYRDSESAYRSNGFIYKPIEEVCWLRAAYRAVEREIAVPVFLLADSVRSQKSEIEAVALTLHPYLYHFYSLFRHVDADWLSRGVSEEEASEIETNLREAFAKLRYQLRSAAKGNKTVIKNHQDRLSQNRTSFRRYLKGLWSEGDVLNISVWSLTYKDSLCIPPTSEKISELVLRIRDDIGALFKKRRQIPSLSKLKGYIWFILFTPKIGVQVRLLCAAPENSSISTNADALKTNLVQAWDNQTQGKGVVLQPDVRKPELSRVFDQMIPSEDQEKRTQVGDHVEYWLLIDQLIHIEPLGRKLRLVGKGYTRGKKT